MAASISAEFPRLLDKSNIYVCVILYLYNFLSSKVNPRGSDFFLSLLTVPMYQPLFFLFILNYVYVFPKYVITD